MKYKTSSLETSPEKARDVLFPPLGHLLPSLPLLLLHFILLFIRLRYLPCLQEPARRKKVINKIMRMVLNQIRATFEHRRAEVLHLWSGL